MAENPLKGIQAGPIVDRACYADQSIFEIERSAIFERTWLCIGHASELKRPGDFRRAEIAGQPLLIAKQADGGVAVLYNSCRHRGTLVEAEAGGNRTCFRCPYHHWEYNLDGTLKYVPREEGYGADFKKEELGLRSVPRSEVFEGLIFATLNRDAPSLASYLGDLAPYLAYVARYNDRPQVAIGSFEYLVNANWKLIWENSQDDYHAEYLHVQAFAQRADVFKMGTTPGIQEVEGTRSPKMLGIHGVLEQVDAPDTLPIQKHRPRRVYTGVFPNLVALYHPIWDVTGLRILQPLAADKTRVLTYCLGPADDDPKTSRERAERYHYSWGPGGRAGVDDILVVEQVQEGLKARKAGEILFTRGLDGNERDGGPADEHPCRALWNGWRQYMLGEHQQAASRSKTTISSPRQMAGMAP